MLFTEALFVIHGIWIVIKSQQKLNCFSLGLAMWLVIIHSFIKHKEFRFVLPFLPLTTVYAGQLSYLRITIDFFSRFKYFSFINEKKQGFVVVIQ